MRVRAYSSRVCRHLFIPLSLIDRDRGVTNGKMLNLSVTV